MANFKAIEKVCEKNTKWVNEVFEESIMHQIIEKEKLFQEVKNQFAKYSHIIEDLEESSYVHLIIQYYVHRILKEDGLINKYLENGMFSDFSVEDHRYIDQLIKYPWKFSFSIILDTPSEDFYLMEDVFTGETLLLYSKSVSKLLETYSARLWFNLIGFNGACWQSFGPVYNYQAFDPDDIYFFTTELNPLKNIETDEEIMEDVESNPVPYMMLISGGSFPMTAHQNDLLIQNASIYDQDTFTTKGLGKDFIIEYNRNVYKLALKDYGEHPHFSAAYYDEKKKQLLLSAMTDRGFKQLADRLNQYGYDFPDESDIHVTMAMLITASKILKKKINVNPYDHLFTKKTTPADKEMTDKLNKMISLALPALNAGETPDYDMLARESGMLEEEVKDLLKQISGNLDNLKK